MPGLIDLIISTPENEKLGLIIGVVEAHKDSLRKRAGRERYTAEGYIRGIASFLMCDESTMAQIDRIIEELRKRKPNE